MLRAFTAQVWPWLLSLSPLGLCLPYSSVPLVSLFASAHRSLTVEVRSLPFHLAIPVWKPICTHPTDTHTFSLPLPPPSGSPQHEKQVTVHKGETCRIKEQYVSCLRSHSPPGLLA